LSGEYALLLRRRALSMLRLAERLLGEAEYDLAALNAEYAAQLFLKSLLYRLSGEEWRGHSVRVLLGLLAYTLEELGLRDAAEKVAELARRNRRILAELEEAHTRAVYGALQYSPRQAEALVNAAKRIVELAESLESEIFESREDAEH